MTAGVAEASSSLLSRYGHRVGGIERHVRGALLALHMSSRRKTLFFQKGNTYNLKGWQDMMKVARKRVSVGIRTGWKGLEIWRQKRERSGGRVHALSLWPVNMGGEGGKGGGIEVESTVGAAKERMASVSYCIVG